MLEFYTGPITTGRDKHASSKLPCEYAAYIRSFAEFLASIRLAPARSIATRTEIASRESRCPILRPCCFEIALNRVAIIQHARSPTLDRELLSFSIVRTSDKLLKSFRVDFT